MAKRLSSLLYAKQPNKKRKVSFEADTKNTQDFLQSQPTDDTVSEEHKNNNNKHKNENNNIANRALITINDITEEFEMNEINKMGFFRRKMSRKSMDKGIVNNANNNNDNDNNSDSNNKSKKNYTKSFEFKVTSFGMEHFKLLVTFCNSNALNNIDLTNTNSDTKNGSKDKSDNDTVIGTTSVSDLEKFVFCADYFMVNELTLSDIEKCYSRCKPCESTHELFKKWKKCSHKLLSELASNLQRKLHPLSSKKSVDRLISIMDQYISYLNSEMTDEIEENMRLLRRQFQIYWIHYIGGKTYFWNIYSIMKKINIFLGKLIDKLMESGSGNDDENDDFKVFCKWVPYVAIVYSYVDFVNCIQRMKDCTSNYLIFIDKMNENICKFYLLFYEKLVQENKEYDISELKKRWYFRLNADGVSNANVMVELIKTLCWYLMDHHLNDFMIRIFWPCADNMFNDNEFIECIAKKCNQMELSQLAEILNGCNIEMYAKRNINQEFNHKYQNIIEKHCYSSINHNHNISVLGWRA